MTAVASPSLVHTTCNILHQPLTENEKIYIDDAATHRFRLAVAAVVSELGWNGRAIGLGLCGRAGIEVTCGACTCPSLVPLRCGARTCPTCARASAAAVSARVAARIALHDAALASVAWDGAVRRKPGTHWKCPVHTSCNCWQTRQWRLVTLNRKPTGSDRWDVEAIRAQLKQAGTLLADWWRSTEWGRQVRDRTTGKKRSRADTSCVWGLEVAPGGMVHFHIVVYGEYVAQVALHKAWRAALARAGVTNPKDGGARVEALRAGNDVRDSIREVLKYATKGGQKDGEPAMPTALQAGVVEVAFRNVRRTGIKGALRHFATPEILDTHLEDLHAEHVMSCEACGVIGEWHFGAIVGREAVQRNKGYGLIRIDALGNDYGGWIICDKPDIGFCDEPLRRQD